MYEAGFLNDRCTLSQRNAPEYEKGVTDYEFHDRVHVYLQENTVWCNWSPVKGKRVLLEGAMELLGVVVVRMRWRRGVDENTRVMYYGKIYQQIAPPMINEREDEIELRVQLMPNKSQYKESL